MSEELAAMAGSLITPAVQGGTFSGGFFLLRWAVQSFWGRIDKREAVVDAGTQRLIDQLQEAQAAQAQRLDKVEKGLDDCRRKHAESEVKALRLEAMPLAARRGLKLAFPPDLATPPDILAAAQQVDGGHP